MRCEVNLSLYKEGEDKMSGTKVEVKNINSFKFVEKAIQYEIERQTEILKLGKKVIQETRGFNANRGNTVSQRVKESAHDYRYFPEPDIPPFKFTKEYVEELKRKLPELPDRKAQRFQKEYGLSHNDVVILVSDKHLASYFEDVISEIKEKIRCKEFELEEKKAVKLAANYMIVETRKHIMEHNHSMSDLKITSENYAELICFAGSGKINSSAAQAVLLEMYKTGGDPSQIIESKNLAQMDDESELEKIVDGIIADNEKSVSDYKAGKENALKHLLGQIMARTKGKANPQKAQEILKSKLK